MGIGSNVEHDEAVALVVAILDTLVAFTPAAVGRPGSDFRRAVGDLRANAHNSINAGTIGTDLLVCFDAALPAGASFENMDQILLGILDEAPVYVLGQAIRAVAVLFAAVEQSRLIIDMEFVSRSAVQVILTRMIATFEIIKLDLADSMDSMSYQASTALSASLINHLAATQLMLPEIVTYQFAPGQPALLLAQRIYGDGSRFEELITENNVVHPAFMPATVRALNA